jgi:hypothetical protein
MMKIQILTYHKEELAFKGELAIAGLLNNQVPFQDRGHMKLILADCLLMQRELEFIIHILMRVKRICEYYLKGQEPEQIPIEDYTPEDTYDPYWAIQQRLGNLPPLSENLLAYFEVVPLIEKQKSDNILFGFQGKVTDDEVLKKQDEQFLKNIEHEMFVETFGKDIEQARKAALSRGSMEEILSLIS